MCRDEYKLIVVDVLKKHDNDVSKLKEIISGINEKIGSLPDEALVYAATLLKIKQRAIFEIANANKSYTVDSRGANCIYVCDGRVCRARKSTEIVEALREAVGLKTGQVTTDDKKFTVETVDCLGDCGNGPVIKINNKNFTKMNVAKAIALVNAMKKGTKIGLNEPVKKTDKNEFKVSGCVKKEGYCKVPMQTTFRQIIDEYAGGMINGHEVKAIFVGDTKTGCYFYGREALDEEIDLTKNTELVRYLSKKGMKVYDDSTCMVEKTLRWMEETMKTSCGRCIPCTEGTKNLVLSLRRIIDGDGNSDDYDELEIFSDTIKSTSMCGIGKMAANPVISLLKYFSTELNEHIDEKKCSTFSCKKLFEVAIDKELCKGCSKCSRICPVEAISGKITEPFSIDSSKCIRCKACVSACNFDAIKLI